MKNLVKYVQNTNSRHNLWKKGEGIILGVSGGADSMTLFHIFSILAKKENLKLIVAHVNYGFREDSYKDEKIVRDFAKKHNIPCEVLSNFKLDKKDCNENKWRQIRFDFFSQIKEKYQADKIVLAHTKNDQSETLLLHLLRGSGLNGLSAIRYKRNNIIRPLLDISREDILKYIKENNISFAIDSSNMNTKFLRNKIRLELLPYLKKNYNENIINTLSQATKNIADDYNYLTDQQEIFWKINDEKTEISFSAQKFSKKHISEQKFSLRTMIFELLGHLQNIESGTIEEIRLLTLSSKNKSQVMQFKNLKIVRKGDIITMFK
ncbi:MAG: tRNA lysidine(34) synthetase TilS [Candidatus Moranbacteria bacterium]|nr:tRNA lysidine(34) synthetase TilS [Candidatus Moranbacteria bacterium]